MDGCTCHTSHTPKEFHAICSNQMLSVSFNGQILERSDYVMISGNPFIKKSGKRFWVSPLLMFQHEAVNITSGVCIKQGGGRYHFTSTSLLKSETRLLNLMKIEMLSSG